MLKNSYSVMHDAAMQMFYPNYYLFMTKIKKIVHDVFASIERRNPNYTSQFEWENIEQEFLKDLRHSSARTGSQANSTLYNFIIAADDDKLSKITHLLVRIFEWQFLEQSRIPRDFGQILRDFQLIGPVFGDLISLSELFHLLGDLTNPNPELTEKWLPIFSVRQANVSASPLLFRQARQTPTYFIKPLKHSGLLGDLASEYLCDKIIFAFGQRHCLPTELHVTEGNVLCLRQPYLRDFRPLLSLEGRLFKQITVEEQKQIFDSLSASQKNQLATILVRALFIGDYDVHPENIVCRQGQLLKIDNQWAFENLVTQRPMVFTDPLNPLRNRARAAPTNHFTDYMPLFDDACFISAIRHFIEQYNEANVKTAVASGLRDLVSIIKTQKPVSREQEDISFVDIIVALLERIGTPTDLRNFTDETLALNTIQDHITAALTFRINSLRLLADALDLQHHLSGNRPNTRTFNEETQLKVEGLNQALATNFPDRKMVPTQVALILLQHHDLMTPERGDVEKITGQKRRFE